MLDNKTTAKHNKKPDRKRNRLEVYNYSLDGAYFLTICTKDKQQILGEVVGDGALGVPTVQLSETGKIVKKYIEHINTTSEYAKVDHYVIMPNHVHLIVTIDNGTPKAPSPINDVIPRTISSIKSLASKEIGKSIWQRSYFDHVIRNETGYKKVWEYIDTNPLRWKADEYYKKTCN